MLAMERDLEKPFEMCEESDPAVDIDNQQVAAFHLTAAIDHGSNQVLR
jgi:hypothetical protein